LPYADGSAKMAMTYAEDGSVRKRKGNKVAMDISPRNLKNLKKRLKMDDFTGGRRLDEAIEEQRRIKKMMKNKKGKA
jgi:ubiquinone/menaquinone biosynthesis C-methylase UbiE